MSTSPFLSAHPALSLLTRSSSAHPPPSPSLPLPLSQLGLRLTYLNPQLLSYLTSQPFLPPPPPPFYVSFPQSYPPPLTHTHTRDVLSLLLCLQISKNQADDLPIIFDARSPRVFPPATQSNSPLLFFPRFWTALSLSPPVAVGNGSGQRDSSLGLGFSDSEIEIVANCTLLFIQVFILMHQISTTCLC